MWAMAIMGGLQLAGALSQHSAQEAQAKYQKAYQKYQNTMTMLSGAQSQNSITQNDIQAEAAFAEQAVGIKQQTILTEASAEVSAASAGVKGRSVNQAMMDIDRNAAVAERQRQINLTNSRLSFDQERRNTALQVESSKDRSYIPQPSLASSLIGAAANTYSFGAGLYGQQANPSSFMQTLYGS